MQGRVNQRGQNEAELMEPAIAKLVRGLRRDLQKKFGRVDYEKLRKAGYSELLLSRLHEVDPQNPPSAGRSSVRSRQA